MHNHSEHKNLVIASRGSKLALWQADYVKTLLSQQGWSADIQVIKTTGDRVQDRFLHEIGGKGLFVREIEEALLAKRADLAIHSLKDLPAKTPAAFRLAAVLKRHQPTDILIWNPKRYYQTTPAPKQISKSELQSAGVLTIATGSLRRTCLLKNANPEIEVIGIRGNVDTRLQKLESSQWDALILAEASLERLDLLPSLKYSRLDPSWFTPSAAQGALVIETLADSSVASVVSPIDCKLTHFHVDIERHVLEFLGGDCTMPFGCYVSSAHGRLTADAVILNMQGECVRAQVQWPLAAVSSPRSHAMEIVAALRTNGAEKILRDLNIKSPF